MMNPSRVRDVLAGLSGSWEPALLVALSEGPLRSAELRRRISYGLDYRVFRDTTERLVDKQLISRHEQEGAVTFQITDAGTVVLELMDGVERWSDQHPDEALLLSAERHPDVKQAGEPEG